MVEIGGCLGKGGNNPKPCPRSIGTNSIKQGCSSPWGHNNLCIDIDPKLLEEYMTLYIHTSHVKFIQRSFEQSWCGGSWGKQSRLTLQGLQFGHMLLLKQDLLVDLVEKFCDRRVCTSWWCRESGSPKGFLHIVLSRTIFAKDGL